MGMRCAHPTVPPITPFLTPPAPQRCTQSTPSRRGCRPCALAAASARCCRRARAAAAALCTPAPLPPTPATPPPLTFPRARALLQAGGGRALYAGVWGNLAGVAPASAIFMAVYEPVKRAVQDAGARMCVWGGWVGWGAGEEARKQADGSRALTTPTHVPPPRVHTHTTHPPTYLPPPPPPAAAVPSDRAFLGPLSAGVAAGLASSLVRVPTEVVKTRMQTGESAR